MNQDHTGDVPRCCSILLLLRGTSANS